MLYKSILIVAGLLVVRLAGATSIGAIQGTGAAARPGTYTVEAIVTGVYAGLKPAGFYVQDDPAAADGNPATSDALFVVQPDPTVAVGDRVRVTGVVREEEAAPSFMQAVLTEPVITVVSAGHALPPFTALVNSAFSVATAERYEGMRVQFTAPLTVTDNYGLKQRGELTVSVAGLTYQPTQFIDPNDDPATGSNSTGTSNLAAIRAYQAANDGKSLVLDDGSAAANPTPTPYLDPRFRTVRVGSTLASMGGILGMAPAAGACSPFRGPRPPPFARCGPSRRPPSGRSI